MHSEREKASTTNESVQGDGEHAKDAVMTKETGSKTPKVSRGSFTKSSASSEQSSTNSNSPRDPNSLTMWRRLWAAFALAKTKMLRLCFVLSMIAAAAVCGYVAYTVTHDLQEDVAIQTYQSVAASALEEAAAICQRKQHGGVVLSSVLSNAFPYSEEWPNQVGLRGYTQIARNVAQQSATSGHGFMIVVRPDEVEEFERHAEDVYRDFNYPESAGVSDFGFGIYGTTPDGERFHDISGDTIYGSPYPIMVPFFQHSNAFVKPALLLMNIHQQKFRGEVIDSIFDCAARADPGLDEFPSCGVVTDFTEIFVRPGPSAVFFNPIYPLFNKTKVVGFIGTSINWEEVLTNVVPDYVDGLDCVISQGTKSYTYVIQNGEPTLVGEGDLHDHAYDSYGHSITLTQNDGTGASLSHVYTLTVYPSSVMLSEFQTEIPTYVAMGFVGVIIACTAIFFLYDYFMQYESKQRKMMMEMKRRFVRFISHEIRTPLNVVCLGLELLQAEIHENLGGSTKPESEAKELSPRETEEEKYKNEREEAGGLSSYLLDLTGDILENTQNAVSVLNDLLNYDKIESGTFKLEFSTVDIWRLVDKTVSEFTIQARNRRVALNSVTTSVAGACPASVNPKKLAVIGDDIRLTQAIRNLISNAIKFTPEDGEVTVTASYVSNGLPHAGPLESSSGNNISDAAKTTATTNRSGSIRISVKDTGAGLSKEQMALLFREYVQFDANTLQGGGGSGLGLCITKEIIQHHGGTIEARSDGRNMGTTFTIEIPLFEIEEQGRDVECPEELASTANLSSMVSSNSFHPRHVLVVDDVISNSKMLVRLLERAGHKCTVAVNGQEAIDAYMDAISNSEADLFDTILMDNQMPVVDGPTATKRLRDLGCSAYIFGVTGNVLAEDVALFKSCGADLVLPKPVSISAIEAAWVHLD